MYDDPPAVVALGANLPSSVGSPLETLLAALNRLQDLSRSELQTSSPYRSLARDCEPGAPDFINAVTLLTPLPELTPPALLRALQAIEAEFGRRRDGSGMRSRTLDLDLVCWGPRHISTPALQLPHPRAAERAFVLAPLLELDPDFRLPGAAVSARELLASLGDDGSDLTLLSWQDV